MGREEEMIKERVKTLEALRKEGIEPYPTQYNQTHHAAELQEKYKKIKNEEKTKDKVSVAGRLMIKRDLGKISVAKMRDGSGDIQIVLQEKETPEKVFEFFNKKVDSGDFVGVEGIIFRTQRGELSVLAKKITLLSKSILPLPEKWHGLQDEEERYRKRYLDLILHPELKDLFIKKQLFWNTIRTFLQTKGFVEVETPVLENTSGGADARPFVTHHNSLDIDVYLRISTGELWQKRLMVGGFEKTFEIGRQFRNEGSSAEHLQDYSQMEFYWAYANYEQGMELVEAMYKELAKKVFETLKFKIHGFDVDFSKKWQQIDYLSEIKKKTGIDFFKASVKDIEKKLLELKIPFEKNLEKERLIDLLWKYCRKQIAGPAFVVHQPVEVSPLAKRSSKDPRLVERFFVLIAGSELGNGYSELNDPLDQEERFKKQQGLREKGDEEAQMHDAEFVEALKYSMPPTCGFGMSERVFAFLVDKPIRECVLFPLLKPKQSESESTGKSKETSIAVAVINKGLKLKSWEELNTIGHLTAAFGARKGKILLYQDEIETKDHKKIKLNIQHAIMIKEIGSNKEIALLLKKAKDEQLEISEFTREMIQT